MNAQTMTDASGQFVPQVTGEFTLNRWAALCRKLGQTAALLVLAGSLLILLGWLANIDLLTRGLPSWPATHPLTAICLLLLASAMRPSPSNELFLFQRIFVWLALTAGSVQFLMYLLNTEIQLDQILFPALSSSNLAKPSRMSLPTSLIIASASAALLLLFDKRRQLVETGQWLAFFPTGIGLVSLAGHAFDVTALFSVFTSIYTSTLACLLGLALFCRKPDYGLMRILGEPGFASVVLKWMLPIGITVPFMLGFIELWLRSHGIVERQTGIFSHVLAISLLFVLAALITAKAGHTLDLNRRKAENAIRTLNDELEQRILHRTAELRESESRFRNLIEVAPYGIVVTNSDGIITLTNPQADKQFGYDRDELIGQAIEVLLPAELQQQHVAYRHQFILRPSYRRMGANRDLEAVRKDGTRFPVEIALAPMSEGEADQVVATVIDITLRKRSENEILQLNTELEQKVLIRTNELHETNKELEAFTYSVSHDLRAPLRHIQGYLELLAEDASNQLSDEGRRYLEIVSTSSREMNTLIDDLLAFSRISRADIQLQEIDMSTLVHSTIDSLRQDIKNRAIDWHIGHLPPVCGDPALIKLALLNLIGNAIKYTRQREQARIEIGFQPADEGDAAYFIKDNGAGFDMKYIDKLFGVFQRLHRQSEFDGTGIGLANVKRIIGKHGGKVWAEGLVDQGASFYFTLPLQQEDSPCLPEKKK